MNQEFKLPVEQTLKRLKGLDNYPVVSRFLQNPENRGRAKTLILEGTNQLVDRFNSFSENTHVFPPYMFRAQMLRETLPNNTLPLLEEIAIATYARALRSGKRAFIAGQNKMKGEPIDTDDIVQTPSMKTSALALIIGTGLHLYERSIFERLRQQHISKIKELDGNQRPFRTDDVLYPLEEVALWMHANAQITAGSQEPVLLPIVASPNALDSSGGLGWRSAEGIRAFKRRFAEYELRRVFEIDQLYGANMSLSSILDAYIEYNPDQYSTRSAAGIKFATDLEMDTARIGALIHMAYGDEPLKMAY